MEKPDIPVCFGEYIPPFQGSDYKRSKWAALRSRLVAFWDNYLAFPVLVFLFGICVASALHPEAAVLLFKPLFK